ncbi:AAA family ATPase [Anaerovibrio slackiae]|uniref:AAA family ATPase n=1 Tax=Anaerovibrio slackiae TaxID=2652309 RepID=UPI003F165635
MKINSLEFENFRSFDRAELRLDGKSTVIFGVNGTGKTSVLKGVNLLYANIINQIVNRKELKQNFNLELDDIKYGKTQTKIKADFYIEDKQITYHRSMVRKTGKRLHDLDALKNIADLFHEKYVDDEQQENIPIFVNYGTNRLVLDIPMRIRNRHIFDIYLNVAEDSLPL